MGSSDKSMRQSNTLGISVSIICLGLILLMMYNSTAQLGWPFWSAAAIAAVIVLVQVRSWRESIRLLRAHRAAAEERNDLANELARIQEAREKAEEAERDIKAAEREHDQASESLQGELTGSTLTELSDSFFHIIAREWELVQGLTYLREENDARYRIASSYAHYSIEETPDEFKLGETLTGQVIQNGESLYLENIPSDYSIIASGLGRCAPSFLFIVPLQGALLKEYGAVELAFFNGLSEEDRSLITTLCKAYETQLQKISPIAGREI